MKIALNDKNVILTRFDIRGADCYRCCFFHSWSLCGIVELRDSTICRTVKILNNTQLNDVFKF